MCTKPLTYVGRVLCPPPAAVEEEVQRFNKAVFKMERGLVPNKASVVWLVT